MIENSLGTGLLGNSGAQRVMFLYQWSEQVSKSLLENYGERSCVDTAAKQLIPTRLMPGLCRNNTLRDNK
jgi:hypothetical protein